MLKRIITLALVIAVALSAAVYAYDHLFTVKLPTYASAARTVWLDQKWTRDQRDWFHHADQGTQTFRIPYEWFNALEQPALFAGKPGLLSDAAYLDRYGFIPSDSSTEVLPIGFAHGGQMRHDDGSIWKNPRTSNSQARIGLTCAACHTGRFTYKNTAVLVSGGPAVTDVFKFQQAVGLALVYTRYVPFRFGRFADRVLGADASNDAKDALKTQLDEVLATYKWVKDREDHANPKKFEEGYTRLDALNRIGNQVFSVAAGEPNNYAAPSAPVNFPPIWNAPWFLWVQYDGSIMQPMVRNAGEALGVVAWLNMKGGGSPMFSSSAQIRELYAIEQQIAGKEPNATDGFSGLQSPKWPEDILPRIDRTLAATGEGLYKENCQHCHLPPVGTPEFWTSPRWKSLRDGGQKYLDLPMIELDRIGTDPEQANGLMNRRITLPANLDLGSEFGPALGKLVERSVNRWYDDQQPSIAEGERDEINGRRPNGIQAVPKYRLRPLNGIWATPPYLHNGSVPTVYALLSPVEERPRTFYLGNREYDPVNLGYVTDTLPNGFLIDTSLAGNRNTGHEFNDNRTKGGVIGRSLKPEERRAIIEFLKTQ